MIRPVRLTSRIALISALTGITTALVAYGSYEVAIASGLVNRRPIPPVAQVIGLGFLSAISGSVGVWAYKLRGVAYLPDPQRREEVTPPTPPQAQKSSTTIPLTPKIQGQPQSQPQPPLPPVSPPGAIEIDSPWDDVEVGR